MNKLKAFIEYLLEQWKTHSIYVWGGQGESGSTITEAWIRKMENSTENANRAIAYWKKQCDAGYKDKLKAFDCSGLGVYFLLNNKLISSDTTADGLMRKCKSISKSELRVGDFVFKTNTSGKATHIGYVVDNGLNVIEARGRDVGVVKAPLTDGGWNAYGRPTYWTDAEVKEVIKEQTGGSTMKVITKTNPLTRGDDIKALQTALNALGYDCGTADGIAGDKTIAAIEKFSAAHGGAVPASVAVTVKAGNKTYTGTAK